MTEKTQAANDRFSAADRLVTTKASQTRVRTGMQLYLFSAAPLFDLQSIWHSRLR
jgi:hypothetical protein